MTTFLYFCIFLGEEISLEDKGNGMFTLRILNTASQSPTIFIHRDIVHPPLWFRLKDSHNWVYIDILQVRGCA